MLAFGIDAAHQLGQVDIQCLRYAAQLNPECIFKADAGFMTANDEGSLYDARTQMAVRATMAVRRKNGMPVTACRRGGRNL